MNTHPARHSACARLLAALGGMVLCLTVTLLHGEERLDLQGTTITGSRELPKALHIVPWQAADPGDLRGKPLNSLVDEILAPLDRDVFLRELEFYEAVHSSK